MTWGRRAISILASAAGCVLIAVALGSTSIHGQAGPQRTFATAEEAVQALVDVVKAGDLDALLAIFGSEGRELVGSSDVATARQNRQIFSVAVAEQRRLVDDGPNRKTLVIGNEDWPFPVPLVMESSRWRFDTTAGKEEVLDRRIGRNELATIATCKAYVAAQLHYAQQGHDGNPAGHYAKAFASTPGKQDGLYWPVSKGEKLSPLGDLMAKAAEEGRTLNKSGAEPTPLYGYYYKILTAQGGAAQGGAKNYIVNGAMTGGFALIAWPSQYDVTGVMTFIVGQDGVVRQKDLGAKTDTAARGMTAYNPDSSWHPAE